MGATAAVETIRSTSLTTFCDQRQEENGLMIRILCVPAIARVVRGERRGVFTSTRELQPTTYPGFFFLDSHRVPGAYEKVGGLYLPEYRPTGNKTKKEAVEVFKV